MWSVAGALTSPGNYDTRTRVAPRSAGYAVYVAMADPLSFQPRGEDVISLDVRVFGRVQGVGFRYFTHELARRLQLSGFVTNLPDRSVRAYAEGPRSALEEFLRQLEQGPAGATVHEARSHWGPATGQYTCFSIEHRMV